MNLILEIDYRERSIINHLNCCNKEIEISDNINIYKDSMNYKISNLPIGDFIFKNENGILFIIERKTIDDLCSSIVDNRFSEQKQRILESIDSPDKIIYIIEGSKNKISKFSKINKNTINSAIQNLILKHQYKVLISESIEDTIEQIFMLYSKINKDNFILQTSTKTLVKKVDNLDIFLNQLCIIPGVSLNIGKKIKEFYQCNCMEDFIIKLNDTNTNTIYLSQIQVTEKRKVGIKLSEKIFNVLKTKTN